MEQWGSHKLIDLDRQDNGDIDVYVKVYIGTVYNFRGDEGYSNYFTIIPNTDNQGGPLRFRSQLVAATGIEEVVRQYRERNQEGNDECRS